MPPLTPYYAVVFVSKMNDLSDEDAKEYEELATRISDLATTQSGYLGVDSVRDESKKGITVSYWADLDSIRQWKLNSYHTMARNQRARFYLYCSTKITKVERAYDFSS